MQTVFSGVCITNYYFGNSPVSFLLFIQHFPLFQPLPHATVVNVYPFIFNVLFILERERESMSREGAERSRGSEVGSVLTAEMSH